MVGPKGITLNKKEGFLEIVWSNDVACRYPLSELREACPCVECRGGHQFMGREHDPENVIESVLEQIFRTLSPMVR